MRIGNELTELKEELEACRRMIRARDMEMSNRSSSAVHIEKLKIDLKAAQQDKSHYKEKCEQLESERQEIEFQMKNASDKLEREMKMVQGEEICMICIRSKCMKNLNIQNIFRVAKQDNTVPERG